MSEANDYRITTAGQLRTLMGLPGELTPKKVWAELDETAINFIKRSPFLVIGTSDRNGHLDASPKGDEPGFVAVEDPRTLLIPDRKGNKLLFGLQNILDTGEVGILFMLPGTDETLRVNGRAELTVDPEILQRLAARGRPALLAIRVRIHECFFHCAKAFRRSQLWHSETWPERMRISFGRMLAPKVGGGASLADKIDQVVEEDYKNNL